MKAPSLATTKWRNEAQLTENATILEDLIAEKCDQDEFTPRIAQVKGKIMSEQTVTAEASASRLEAFTRAFNRGRQHWRTRQHLLDTDDLTPGELASITDVATEAKKILKAGDAPLSVLHTRTIATAFYENSTRTRSSFELAARRLGATLLNLDVASSSVVKGETIIDTSKTLLSMGVQALIQRHSASGSARQMARELGDRLHLINAGDGWNAHPTQALLDYFTMSEVRGSLNGAKIAIVGDLKHSRVARSNIRLLTRCGAMVHTAGPPTLTPIDLGKMGVIVHSKVEPAIENADFVMVLRIQLERQKQGLIPSIGEYRRLYRIDSARMRLAKPEARVLHPGPMNRDVEISDELAECSEKSLITTQVTNGVAVRMAVLYLLLGE